MKKRIAVGGSAANPPTAGHFALLKALLDCGRFDRIIWILSGERLDKKIEVCPNHRIAMTELMIGEELRCRVKPDLFVIYDDIYGENTPTIEWLERLQQQYPDDELVWFTGTDSVISADRSREICAIEAKWQRGRELMEKWPFLFVTRAGYEELGVNFERAVFPAGFRYEILDAGLPNTSSSLARVHISRGVPIDQIGVPGQRTLGDAVANYIKLHGLYGCKE